MTLRGHNGVTHKWFQLKSRIVFVVAQTQYACNFVVIRLDQARVDWRSDMSIWSIQELDFLSGSLSLSRSAGARVKA